MAIAITPFDGLCGFRPLKETAHFLRTIPALRKLVGEEKVNNFDSTVKDHETSGDEKTMDMNKKALRDCFAALMNADKDAITSAAKDLVSSAKDNPESFAEGGGPRPDSGKELAELVIRLDGQFPGDIGLFVLFFLNYVKLAPGEAMFLRADDIHAYLSGGESHDYLLYGRGY